MLGGSPYKRLIAENDEPVPSVRQAEEVRKLQREIYKRQHETKEERDQRIDRYSKERDQDRVDDNATLYGRKLENRDIVTNGVRARRRLPYPGRGELHHRQPAGVEAVLSSLQGNQRLSVPPQPESGRAPQQAEPAKQRQGETTEISKRGQRPEEFEPMTPARQRSAPERLDTKGRSELCLR